MVDPKNPGAVDYILNFGEYWDEKGIRVHKDDIIKTNKEIGAIFARAYKYLKAAYAIYQDSMVINSMALNKGELNIRTSELINEIFGSLEPVSEEGKLRSLFASAMTPKGLCNYLDNILTADVIYEIKGGIGSCEEKILEKLKVAALERGFFVEAYYCALNPYKLEHLLIPELNVAVTTTNSYHTSTVEKYCTVDMKDFLNQDIILSHSKDLAQNADEFDNLLSIALNTISRAKTLHDRLETYYINNINFNAIDECFTETIEKILKI